MAAGELITFIDSDDLLEADHLATAAQAFAQYPNLGLFCCDAHMIGPEGEVLHDGRTWHTINGEIKNYSVQTGPRSLEDIFLFSNSFPGFTLRREVFEALGGLDQTIFPLDDYDLALRVAGAGYSVHYCHRPLARYRDHGGNSSGAGNGIKVGREKLRCLQRALACNPELRALGGEVGRRLADVMSELAICQFKAGQMGAGALTAMRALLASPGQATQWLKLGARKFHRNPEVV
jgi:hypothetical protein